MTSSQILAPPRLIITLDLIYIPNSVPVTSNFQHDCSILKFTMTSPARSLLHPLIVNLDLSMLSPATPSPHLCSSHFRATSCQLQLRLVHLQSTFKHVDGAWNESCDCDVRVLNKVASLDFHKVQLF